MIKDSEIYMEQNHTKDSKADKTRHEVSRVRGAGEREQASQPVRKAR